MPKCEYFPIEQPVRLQISSELSGEIFLFNRDLDTRILPDALRSTVCLIDAVCTGQCDIDEEFCGRCGYGVAIQTEREVLDEYIIK